MESRFLVHLVDVSLRSLPLAMTGVAIVRIARLRSAAPVHAVWTVVMLGMLGLFFAGPSLKPLPLRILPAPRIAEEQIVLAAPQGIERGQAQSQSGPTAAMPRTVPAQRSIGWSEVGVWIYGAIALAMLGRLLVGAWLARRLRVGSTAVDGRFYESSRVTVPLTVGWIKPRILLPAHWRNWSPAELEAILLHESSHVRRRDSAVGLLAGINRCVFWFHPLAWWIEQKLALLAEQACDEACVHSLKNRRQYARLLMELAADAEAAGGRLSQHVLAMARPSQVHRRIDAILDESRLGHRGITRLGWTAVLLCGVPMIYAAGTVRMEPRQAQTVSRLPAAVAVAGPEPLLIAQGTQPAPRPTPAQPRVNPAPPAPAPVTQDEQVLVTVTVTDPRGRFVAGLNASNFQVFNRDEQQPISGFSEAEGQHAIALVLNTATDMTNVADAFQKALGPRDESFVMQANIPGDSDPKVFMDLIDTAVDAVKERKNPAKAVVVITHGGSNVPMAAERDVSNLIRHAGNTPIFFVDIQENGNGQGSSQADDMRDFAQLGGAYVPVANAVDLSAAVTRLAIQLRNQYLLGFVPTPASSEGVLQNLRVNVALPGVKVGASRFYFPR